MGRVYIFLYVGLSVLLCGLSQLYATNLTYSEIERLVQQKDCQSTGEENCYSLGRYGKKWIKKTLHHCLQKKRFTRCVQKAYRQQYPEIKKGQVGFLKKTSPVILQTWVYPQCGNSPSSSGKDLFSWQGCVSSQLRTLFDETKKHKDVLSNKKITIDEIRLEMKKALKKGDPIAAFTADLCHGLNGLTRTCAIKAAQILANDTNSGRNAMSKMGRTKWLGALSGICSTTIVPGNRGCDYSLKTAFVPSNKKIQYKKSSPSTQVAVNRYRGPKEQQRDISLEGENITGEAHYRFSFPEDCGQEDKLARIEAFHDRELECRKEGMLFPWSERLHHETADIAATAYLIPEMIKESKSRLWNGYLNHFLSEDFKGSDCSMEASIARATKSLNQHLTGYEGISKNTKQFESFNHCMRRESFQSYSSPVAQLSRHLRDVCLAQNGKGGIRLPTEVEKILKKQDKEFNKKFIDAGLEIQSLDERIFNFKNKKCNFSQKCGEVFDQIDGCTKSLTSHSICKYIIQSDGQVKINEELRPYYDQYKKLVKNKNSILKKYPQLGVVLERPKGKAFYSTLSTDSYKKSDQKVKRAFDASQAKRLKAMSKVCDAQGGGVEDQKEFLLTLVKESPELINYYLQKTGNENLAPAACFLNKEANKFSWSKAAWDYAETASTVIALGAGFALAPLTGGASMVAAGVLGTAVTATVHVHQLNETQEDLELKQGLYQAQMISNYETIEKAAQAKEDAEFWTLVDAVVETGSFGFSKFLKPVKNVVGKGMTVGEAADVMRKAERAVQEATLKGAKTVDLKDVVKDLDELIEAREVLRAKGYHGVPLDEIGVTKIGEPQKLAKQTIGPSKKINWKQLQGQRPCEINSYYCHEARRTLASDLANSGLTKESIESVELGALEGFPVSVVDSAGSVNTVRLDAVIERGRVQLYQNGEIFKPKKGVQYRLDHPKIANHPQLQKTRDLERYEHFLLETATRPETSEVVKENLLVEIDNLHKAKNLEGSHISVRYETKDGLGRQVDGYLKLEVNGTHLNYVIENPANGKITKIPDVSLVDFEKGSILNQYQDQLIKQWADLQGTGTQNLRNEITVKDQRVLQFKELSGQKVSVNYKDQKGVFRNITGHYSAEMFDGELRIVLNSENGKITSVSFDQIISVKSNEVIDLKDIPRTKMDSPRRTSALVDARRVRRVRSTETPTQTYARQHFQRNQGEFQPLEGKTRELAESVYNTETLPVQPPVVSHRYYQWTNEALVLRAENIYKKTRNGKPFTAKQQRLFIEAHEYGRGGYGKYTPSEIKRKRELMAEAFPDPKDRDFINRMVREGYVGSASSTPPGGYPRISSMPRVTPELPVQVTRPKISYPISAPGNMILSPYGTVDQLFNGLAKAEGRSAVQNIRAPKVASLTLQDGRFESVLVLGNNPDGTIKTLRKLPQSKWKLENFPEHFFLEGTSGKIQFDPDALATSRGQVLIQNSFEFHGLDVFKRGETSINEAVGKVGYIGMGENHYQKVLIVGTSKDGKKIKYLSYQYPNWGVVESDIGYFSSGKFLDSVSANSPVEIPPQVGNPGIKPLSQRRPVLPQRGNSIPPRAGEIKPPSSRSGSLFKPPESRPLTPRQTPIVRGRPSGEGPQRIPGVSEVRDSNVPISRRGSVLNRSQNQSVSLGSVRGNHVPPTQGEIKSSSGKFDSSLTTKPVQKRVKVRTNRPDSKPKVSGEIKHNDSIEANVKKAVGQEFQSRFQNVNGTEVDQLSVYFKSQIDDSSRLSMVDGSNGGIQPGVMERRGFTQANIIRFYDPSSKTYRFKLSSNSKIKDKNLNNLVQQFLKELNEEGVPSVPKTYPFGKTGETLRITGIHGGTVEIDLSKIPVKDPVETPGYAWDGFQRKLGVERLIKRELTAKEYQGLIEAHEVPGKGFWKYTPSQLAKKRIILERVGFNRREILLIMRKGYAGKSLNIPQKILLNQNKKHLIEKISEVKKSSFRNSVESNQKRVLRSDSVSQFDQAVPMSSPEAYTVSRVEFGVNRNLTRHLEITSPNASSPQKVAIDRYVSKGDSKQVWYRVNSTDPEMKVLEFELNRGKEPPPWFNSQRKRFPTWDFRKYSWKDEEILYSAQKELGRDLSSNEAHALLVAHHIGDSRPGAGLFNYQPDEIIEKTRVLKDAGFSKEERQFLLDKGFAGKSQVTDTSVQVIDTSMSSVSAFRPLSISNYCESCPKRIQLLSANDSHYLDHFPIRGKVEHIGDALKYSREGKSTSLFPEGINPSDIVNQGMLEDHWVPDSKLQKLFMEAKAQGRNLDDFFLEQSKKDNLGLKEWCQLNGINCETMAFETDVKINHPKYPGNYKFRVVICRMEKCAPAPGQKKIPRKGDIVSLIPVCGPGVLQIPPRHRIEEYVEKRNHRIVSGDFGTRKAKIKKKKCKKVGMIYFKNAKVQIVFFA